MPSKHLTADERKARREADREFAEHAVEALRQSQGWRDWLRVRATFRRYSPSNTLLIAMQCPHATHVAGFRAWLGLGYAVRKGERALRIWAPVPPSKRQLELWRERGGDAADKPRTYFRLTAVFDVSQVDPLPPPAEPAALEPPVADITGDSLSSSWQPLVEFALAIGSDVSCEEIIAGAHGYYDVRSKRIVIEAGLASNAKVATLVHEVAHALVRADRRSDDPELDYALEELVAESVAFTVTRGLGLDVSDASIPYLTSWSQDAPSDALHQVARLVDRLASRIEDALDANDAPRSA